MAVTPRRLDWLDPLKALALCGILLNHLVEEFGRGPWFTNPTRDWPDLATRMQDLRPDASSPLPGPVQWLGWLGDSGPGVFILLSGFGLTWGLLHRGAAAVPALPFYRRRLLRILPLYVAAHFVVLGAALVVPGSDLTMASPRTLLSMLGLRATDGLFFSINPSWWFVWCILQLYCVFPLLYRLLQRLGPARYLLAAVLVTFLFRGLGLVGARPNASLFCYLTGLFAGTRLAEFALGMALARLLHGNPNLAERHLRAKKVLAWAAPTYGLGLLCSWTWVGSIAANLLVTAGLTGLLFALWCLLRRSAAAARSLQWLGGAAFAAYLVHQTPLQWTRTLFPDHHLGAALAILVLSIPCGAVLERAVRWGTRVTAAPCSARAYRATLAVAAVLAAGAFAGATAYLGDPVAQRGSAFVLASVAVGLLLLARRAPSSCGWPGRWLHWALALCLLLSVFALPLDRWPGAVPLAVAAATAVLLLHRIDSRPLALLGGGAAALSVFAVGEVLLTRLRPVEAGGWGELPVLQRHDTRTYALKPEFTGRLHYNDYDYTIRTNSLGLASPELATERTESGTLRVLVIGDAFAMPEGMAYRRAFPALLERRLGAALAPQRLEVVNAGVTGYGPAEQLPQLRELAPLLRPDLVIYEFFINEFDEVALAPDSRLREIGLVHDRSWSRHALLDRSQYFARARLCTFSLQELLTGRPGAWRTGKALLSYHWTGPQPRYAADRLATLRAHLLAMRDAADVVGARFAIAFVPGAIAVSAPDQIDYFPWDQDLGDAARYELGRPLRELRGAIDGLEIPLHDLTPALRGHAVQPVYFPSSWHWNPTGHAVVADDLAQWILAADLLPK